MADLTDEQLAEWEQAADELVSVSRSGRVDNLIAAVPLLLRALRDARAENEALRAQAGRHGACIGCNYNDGPDEFCPQHGRTYDDLLGILDKVASERDSLRAENERLQARRLPPNVCGATDQGGLDVCTLPPHSVELLPAKHPMHRRFHQDWRDGRLWAEWSSVTDSDEGRLWPDGHVGIRAALAAPTGQEGAE